MKICPVCKKQFDENIGFCPFDGQLLSASKSTDDHIGRIIDYKYQIEEPIARGGTGIVYKGKHLHLNMPIAIKVMHRQTASDFTSVERFRREAYAMMRIRHPNAIAVMDFGVTPDNLVYVVMERLEGKTLRQRLREERFLGLQEINEIMQQIFAAVAIAHKRKIIHRDLKPENIFIHKDDDSNVVKVLDFGIAKFKGLEVDASELELTRQGFVIGTPYYMSPEQCYGKEVDARSDIYSLGIMLYELLTGKLPFTGRSHTAVAVKQAREKAKAIYELRPNLPAVLNAVVMHALEKSPSNRPQNVKILADELDAAMKAVTENEFKKVFMEASEQDLEAAVLLTADPKILAERVVSAKQKRSASVEYDLEVSVTDEEEICDLPTVTTELDEESIDPSLPTSTMSFSNNELEKRAADSTVSLSSPPVENPQTENSSGSKDDFFHIGKETTMLLQILLGDLENEQPVDRVFLSELKGNVDLLRTAIYRLQQTES